MSAEGGEGDGLVARSGERRTLDDPRVMRALAHPTRLALLEALSREGPMTATEAATLLDDSPGNLSWHLQILAKHGFIEETGTGKGRRRPWRLVSLGTSFHGDDDRADLQAAGDLLEEVGRERTFARIREWAADRHLATSEWRAAAFSSTFLLYLTPDELGELGDELMALVDRYRHRTLDRSVRPEGSAPVQVTAFGYPLRPTPSGN